LIDMLVIEPNEEQKELAEDIFHAMRNVLDEKIYAHNGICGTEVCYLRCLLNELLDLQLIEMIISSKNWYENKEDYKGQVRECHEWNE